MQMKLQSDSLLMPLHELKEKQERLDTSIALMQDQQNEFESIIKGKVNLLESQVNAVISKESAVIKNDIFQSWIVWMTF